MFGGDWRWTVMAYNAGEGAARAARRKGGAKTLSSITRHYPDKLHALACLVPRPPDPGRASG
jgi:membrane-bound lytic murein transglycosylase D